MGFLEPQGLQKDTNNSSAHTTNPLLSQERPTMGRMNLSYLGGFLVKPSPTYVTFVTIRFHAFPGKTNSMISLQNG